MEKEVRIPQQKRSIEKKAKIIDAAFEVFNEKGYFNTNTAEIAQKAGLSIGCLYSYFKDKKEIFICVLDKYSEGVYRIVSDRIDTMDLNVDIFEVIKEVVNIVIETHHFSEKFHAEAMALSFLDQDIKAHLRKVDQNLILGFLDELEKKDELRKRGIHFQYEKEQGFIIHTIVDNLCHEIAYNKNSPLDRETVVSECAKLIKNMVI